MRGFEKKLQTDFKCSAKSTNFTSKTTTVGNEALQKEFPDSNWKPFVQFQNEGCEEIKNVRKVKELESTIM
jgi:hypothetical protein